MRFVAVCLALVALAVPTAGAHATSAGTTPLIPCDDAIGAVRSGTQSGYRVLLGIVSVPPAQLTQVVATRSKPWLYWRKAGLVIHPSNRMVSLTVPKAWRKRAAISWGGSGRVSALKFEPCPTGKLWNAYAGGFYLRAHRECVPLILRVGSRAQTVRFGVGGSCSRG
jgi:hypothetical protein